jgi:hypothetical protein
VYEHFLCHGHKSLDKVPTRMGSGRMTIRKFDAVIHITSPTSARTHLVANINPNISFLPNSLLEFGMKHVAAVVLAKLQGASKKAALYPVTNSHAIKMREEKEFYHTWLLAKFRGVCEARNWDMPPVAAFNLSATDLQKAQRLNSHGYKRAQTYNGESPEEDDNEVVENLAALSQSARDAVSDYGDNMSMSALSNETGQRSVWSNNPVATYLRETERKIQQRKADEVAESRRHAAARLQPKERPMDVQERLTALKLAKYRRMDLSVREVTGTIISPSSGGGPSPNKSKSLSQRLAYHLYHHNPKTRLWVVVSLVGILFTMLHSGLLIQNSFIDPSNAQLPWYLNRWKDVGVVTYILLCTVPYFLLVDVSLVYTFDALDLGSKTGGQAKTYYSDNVWLASIVASFGIAAISIATALSKAFLRAFIWSIFRVYGLLGSKVFIPSLALLKKSVHFLPHDILEVIVTSVLSALSVVNFIINKTAWIVHIISTLSWNIFVQSNFVGKGIANVLSSCLSACIHGVEQINTFIECSIKSFDGDVFITPWRVEAFITTRFLFMNTAVFLLVALTLFYISSRKAVNPPKEQLSKSEITVNGSELHQPRSDDSYQQRYAAIPEEKVVLVDHDDEANKPFTPDESTESVGVRKRRRFRFRQGKSSSSPNISNAGRKQLPKKPVDRDRLAHSKSY